MITERKMHQINRAIGNVTRKRLKKGASIESVNGWLRGLAYTHRRNEPVKSYIAHSLHKLSMAER